MGLYGPNRHKPGVVTVWVELYDREYGVRATAEPDEIWGHAVVMADGQELAVEFDRWLAKYAADMGQTTRLALSELDERLSLEWLRQREQAESDDEDRSVELALNLRRYLNA